MLIYNEQTEALVLW